MLTIRRESLDIPQGRRILAVSDIHGHVHFLKKVLERAGFCEADELIIDGAWKTPSRPCDFGKCGLLAAGTDREQGTGDDEGTG